MNRERISGQFDRKIQVAVAGACLGLSLACFMPTSSLSDAEAESTRVATIFDDMCSNPNAMYLGPQMDRSIGTSLGEATISRLDQESDGSWRVRLNLTDDTERQINLELDEPKEIKELGIELEVVETEEYTDPKTGKKVGQSLKGVCVRHLN